MQKVFGGILLGIGILIAGLSGLCSLFAAMDLLFSGRSGGGENFLDWPTLFFVGGIPFAIGFGMAFGGWKLLNAGSAPTSQPPAASMAIKPAEPAAPPTSDAE